ncbi:MAG: hypothetical protein K2N70_01700 [Helicobacter sp.]|nr:hypothetical protein [Helicobacter sp.]
METEKFNIANAVCEIVGIRFCLVCKILKYELENTSAVDALISIAQIDEGELNRLRELINNMFFEATKLDQEALERGISDGTIDINCAIDNDMEELVERMISYIKDEKRNQAWNILVNIYLNAHEKQNVETVRKEINHVFDCAHELRMKGFLGLEKIIAEAARPIENGKPIVELKEKTTEAIRLVRAWRLGRERLKDYMDSEISKIYLCRAMREYKNLWGHTKDASANETIGLIHQIIQGMEDKMKADFVFEQDERKNAINEAKKMIKDSLSEAGVQDANEGGEIFKDLIDIFVEQGILYRGSADYYNRLLEIGKKFKP